MFGTKLFFNFIRSFLGLSSFLPLMRKKYANTVLWGFLTFINQYMFIFEQSLSAYEH